MLCPHLGLQSIDSATPSFSAHFSSFQLISSAFLHHETSPKSISTLSVAASSQPITTHSHLSFYPYWLPSLLNLLFSREWPHIVKPNDLLCLSGKLSEASAIAALSLLEPHYLACWLSSHFIDCPFSGSLQTHLISVGAQSWVLSSSLPVLSQ